MSFEISGYVLEPPRVGQANSPFTQTPDNLISDQVAFDAAYPASEANPRTDYLVVITTEGPTLPGLLVNAGFGWTKNEIVQRFDYQAREGRFKPLPGLELSVAGTLDANANTTRIKVTAPVQAALVPEAPYRLSVGSTGSGTTFSVTIVANDAGFGSPPPGTAELSLETGNLNWNVTDLTTFSGQVVRFQQQQFVPFERSTGRIGFAPVNPSDPAVLLNPKPGPGQFPLLRFGYSLYLQTVEVANEGAFTIPPVGTVQWALTTGRLNFNPTDASNHAGIAVYYDGVLFDRDQQLPRQNLGNISAPSAIVGLPPSGGDLIFAVPGAAPYYQFPRFAYVGSFNSGQAGTVQIDPSTGDIQFSTADQQTYVGESVEVVFGDLPIERGISLRLFRTPVDLDASQPSIKDVTAIYEVENAVWADPIIGSPQVFLPSTPIDDPSYLVRVKVEQGQGTFLSNDFPRLDVPVPPAGLGYFIDFDERVLHFAQRKNQTLVPIAVLSGAVGLPDPLVLAGNVSLEIETGPNTGTYVPLVLGTDALFDGLSGVVTFINNHGTTIVEGTGASFSGTVFTDTSANFIVTGVQLGDLIEVLSTSARGVYTVVGVAATILTTDVVAQTPSLSGPPVPVSVTGALYTIRRGQEVLADRFFSEVSLLDPTTRVERIRSMGVCQNSPRLSVTLNSIASVRFRFGPASGNQFSTSVTIVPNDGAFTNPLLLPAFTVEISQSTGNVNFSSANLGSTVYSVRTLTPKIDYLLSAGLGLIQFTERLLELEEVLVRYTTAPPSTDPPTDPGSPIEEYARFLVRKEVTLPHPAPTSTLSFNPLGRPVAATPPPAVFRGGRPQVNGTQCVVDVDTSTITFLADNQITNALPHGAIVNPNERVYIDYYVTAAIGGEQTTTVLNPPLLTAVVNIVEDTNEFTVRGDQTANFPGGALLRIEQQEVYLLGGSTYDAGANETTVTLFGSQAFQTTFTDPKVYVSSGPTPITSGPFTPAYFASELQGFEPIARGMNRFFVSGDRTSSYRTGTVLMFTDGGPTFTDFIQVSGARYDADASRTEVILTANALRQYVDGAQQLNYSVRPLFEPPTVNVQSVQVPVLSEPIIVYRRSSGEAGILLSSPDDYTTDDSGQVTFTTPLFPNEEFGIFYSGFRVVQAGINIRASYTSEVAPTETNGLLGQILRADYFIYSPDTFYYRVETMTNFRGEYAQGIEAEASSGSSGPQTENASQPQLFEQGRTSLYFNEKHLANQDIIARSSLLFYNTAVNFLEAYLRALDGRVVGNNDGPFLFDGTTGAQHPPGSVTNQIDDVIKVSNAPYTITFPPFAVTSVGTFRKYYVPGSMSRFYPTSKNFFGVSAVSPTTQPGDEVLDTGATNVTLVSNLHTRLAWAVLTESTEFSGPSTLKVDNADGSDEFARPPFKNGMKCVVQRRDGTFINDAASPVTVSAVSTNQLTISGLADTAEAGTTIYRSPIDDSAQSGADTLTYYLLSRDYSFDGESGQVTYVQEIAALSNTPLVEEQALSGKINLINSLTAPLKFPALYGGIEDDDGDMSFPIQTPDPVNEQTGYLFTEDKIIHDPTGLLRTLTTSPFVGSGSLNAARTVITNLAGNFPAPAPKAHDLVRITSGLNGVTSFVRITSVTASSVTVATPFALQDSGFTFVVTVSALAVTGTTDLTSTTTVLDDALATFLTSVAVGQTVVATSGANLGQRRQIASIQSDTQLTVTPAFPSTLAGETYRVDNSLSTYGGTASDYLLELVTALTGELTLYPAEQQYILDFLNQVFTDITTGATGQTTAGQAFLDDAGASFLNDEVTAAYFVFIQTGANAGFYRIQSVNSQTQLQMTTNFPATLAGVSYRVVKLFGASPESVETLFGLYQSIAALLTSAIGFQALISTSVLVTGQPNFFARGTLTSDLDARDAIVDARISAIPTTITSVEAILASTDMLYDKRYTWIDARINLESGLVVQQATAVTNRIKAQQEVYNQLIKLLAVQEA